MSWMGCCLAPRGSPSRNGLPLRSHPRRKTYVRAPRYDGASGAHPRAKCALSRPWHKGVAGSRPRCEVRRAYTLGALVLRVPSRDIPWWRAPGAASWRAPGASRARFTTRRPGPRCLGCEAPTRAGTSPRRLLEGACHHSHPSRHRHPRRRRHSNSIVILPSSELSVSHSSEPNELVCEVIEASCSGSVRH